jgi:hypothetical protein
MAIKTTKKRQTWLAELLKPFRATYLLNRKHTKRFCAILGQLHELAQGDDEVALAARINLADYYRTIGNKDKVLEFLSVTMVPHSPQPILYEGAMMYGALCLEGDSRQAVDCYRKAALVAGDRDAFSSAYDGLAMSIAVTTTGEQWELPAILVNDGIQADRFWRDQTNWYTGPWDHFGDRMDVTLAYVHPYRQVSDVIMCIVDDDPLFTKRKSLWGNDPFAVVTPGIGAVGIRTGADESMISAHPSQQVVDLWGNAVRFSSISAPTNMGVPMV